MTHRISAESRPTYVCTCAAVFAELVDAGSHLREHLAAEENPRIAARLRRMDTHLAARREGEPTEIAKSPCPRCGQSVSVRPQSRGVHARRTHNATWADLEGEAAGGKD